MIPAEDTGPDDSPLDAPVALPGRDSHTAAVALPAEGAGNGPVDAANGPIDAGNGPAAVVVAPAPARPEATLADRVGMIVGSQFVTAAIGMAQNILVVRLLTKSDYGAMAFVLAIYGTGRDLGLSGIPESILYFAPKASTAELKGLVRQSRILLLGLGLFVGMILAGLSLWPSLFLDGQQGLSTMLVLVAVSTVLGFPASLFGNVFIATNNHRRSAGIALVMTVLGATGALLPAALGWPVDVIIGFHALNMGIRLVLSEWLYRRLFPGPTAPFPGGLRAQLKYVIPLSVTRFAGIFNQKLDKFVVGLFFAAGAFAEFAVGAQELPLVSILPYSVATALMPKIVELFETSTDRTAGARRSIELWHTSIRKVTLVMVPVAAFLLVGAVPLMRTLYGDAYAGAAGPFRIYGALLPLRVTSYGIMLMAFNDTRAILRAQIIGIALNVAASFLLLSWIGMLGAPLSAVLTQAFMIVFMLYRINKVGKVGLSGIFPWGHYGRVALASLAGAGAVALLAFVPAIAARPSLTLIAGIPLFAAVYLPLAIMLKTMNAEDRAFVSRWLRLEPIRR